MADIKALRSVVIITAALGWWGIWFPELAVWGNAVCVADQQVKSEEMRPWQESDIDFVWEVWDGFRNAERSQIQIKSRLLSAIDQYFQKK